MPILGRNSKDDVHITSCEEAVGNVSMMVWVNSNSRFVHAFYPSRCSQPSTSADFEMPTTLVHSPAARAALSVSPFYRLRSSIPSTPNRSFISGAFTIPGASSVSTATSVWHDPFRDYKLTNGGPVTPTPNAQMSESRGDDVELRVGGGVGGEIGKVLREINESKAGVVEVPADLKARKQEVVLNSLPQTASKGAGSHRHTRSFGELLRKIVPSRRPSKVPSRAASPSPPPSAGSSAQHPTRCHV
jgi:hypothetical protein